MIFERYRELALLVCLVLVLAVLELVRRKRLGVRYSLVWLGVTAVMALVALWKAPLDLVRRAIGAVNPSSTLFFLGILFSLVILLHFSIKISEYSQQIRLLAKEIGMLKEKLERREREGSKEGAGPPSPPPSG